MKFSIVISTYNRLNLLRRAIDSALAQTISCEVVVADDCSTDDTQAYIHSLGEQVVYHRNPQNQGHSKTVNAGVQAASGDWIKFIDDDDYLAPNCVEEMMQAIQLRSQAVICSCRAIQVDEHEHELRRTYRVGPGRAFYIPQEDIHYGMLLEQIPFGTPVQVACQRDAFLKSGGWDSSLDANCDDIDSWVKIAQFGDAIFINVCLAYRTVWTGAYNRKFPLQKRLETNLLIKTRIYGFVNETYHDQLPKQEEIQAYLNLHWAGVALKQGQISTALSLIFPAVFSGPAWKLLINAIWLKFVPVVLPEDSLNVQLLDNLLTEPSQEQKSNWQTLRSYALLRGIWLSLKQGEVNKAAEMAGIMLRSPQNWKFIFMLLTTQTKPKLSLFPEENSSISLTKRIQRAVEKRYLCADSEAKKILDYLMLHWALTALKQGNFQVGLNLLFPAALSPIAWKLLYDQNKLEQKGDRHIIRKLVLIESQF